MASFVAVVVGFVFLVCFFFWGGGVSKEVDVSEWRSEFFTDMQRFSCVCATIRCVEVALGVHHVMPQDLINYRV